MRAIQMHEFGGPEVLRLVELPEPEPGPEEALIRVSRAGVNFADTHTRTNSYVQPATLPLVPGRVIASASSEEKRALARELGADAAIDPAPEGLTERLLEANGGDPVDVVFEMAGGEVFDASYRALAPFGRIVAYGIASQQPNSPSTGSLLRHSRAVVGIYLFHCLQRPGTI